MTDPFKYISYKGFLQDLVKFREERGQTRAELAKAMGCQAAYFSQVLKAKADLTEDHGIKLCRHLKLNAAETEYFLLILRLSRAGTQALSEYLEEQRLKLKKTHDEIEGRVQSRKNRWTTEREIYYCSSWIPSTLHTATSCESYQTVSTLSRRFDLDPSLVEGHLHALEKFGLIQFNEGRWIFQGASMHFPKNTPLDQAFQLNHRVHAMHALAAKKEEEIHYAAVFAADRKTFIRIR